MLTVFTTKTCGQCKQVKKVLEHFKYEYQTVDIEENPSFAQLILEKTGVLNVPVTTDGNKYVVGYNVKEIMSLSR